MQIRVFAGLFPSDSGLHIDFPGTFLNLLQTKERSGT